MSHPANDLRLPPIIGHRGAAADAPENTLAGFRTAARLGVSWVEFDVQLSADKVPVVIHDRRLDRTTSGRGLVRRTPLARLRQLDCGSWFSPAFAGEAMPTLAEALTEIAGLGLGVNIEIKPDRGWEALTAAVALETAAAVWPETAPPPLVSSFDRQCLAVARQTVPRWPRGLLCRALPSDWHRAAEEFACASVHCHHRLVTPERVAAVRGAGYHVLAYTVNDRSQAQRLWNWGVSAVFTDVPRVLSPP